MIKTKEKTVLQLPVNQLRPFEGNPYQVKDDAEMARLIESIQTQGILTPLTVRPLNDGHYEVISGHRRLYACQRAGIQTVPTFAAPMSREEAAIALVDSNLHREHILPSEKAFAYKLKMDALRHQGISRQPGEKLSVAQISEAGTDSERQIHRYIRLTELTPELLTLVDDGRISLTPAVEISYLSQEEQYALLEAIQSEDRTPSLSQAQQLRKLSQSGELDADRALQIMCQPKANQMEKISLDYGELRRFFPRRYTPTPTQRQRFTHTRLLSPERQPRMSGRGCLREENSRIYGKTVFYEKVRSFPPLILSYPQTIPKANFEQTQNKQKS